MTDASFRRAQAMYDAQTPEDYGYRETTDADLARDALDDLRSAARQFADAWRVARQAINDLAGTGYDWQGDDATAAYETMMSADDACRAYIDAVQANIDAGGR